MIDLDGTPNKGRLGANATARRVDGAPCAPAAAEEQVPLYEHIGALRHALAGGGTPICCPCR